MFKNKHWKYWLALGLLVLACVARLWKMEYVPAALDHDELAHIYDGLSLIDLGRPISWSSFEHASTQWRKQEIHVTASSDGSDRKQYQTFINPWIDHPPVLAGLIGTYLHVLGYHFPDIPPALVYRLPMVILGLGTLGLIFLVSVELFGIDAGIFALIVAGFSPVLVFGQRMLIGENLISFFVLATLYLYIKKRSLFWVFLACVLAGWTKLTGLMLVPIFLLDLLMQKRWRAVIGYSVFTTVMVAGFYGAFGLHFGWPQFIDAMHIQSFRLLGWSNPAFLFSNPGFDIKPILDFSYYLILFLGFGFVIFGENTPNSRLIKMSTLAALVTVWATGAETDALGWYKLPLFCLLAIGTGYAWQAKKEWGITALVGFTIVNNFGLVRFPTHFYPEAIILRSTVGGLLLLLMFLLYTHKVGKMQIARWAVSAVLIIYIGQSFYVENSYFSGLCKDRNCITPTVTLIGTIKQKLGR